MEDLINNTLASSLIYSLNYCDGHIYMLIGGGCMALVSQQVYFRTNNLFTNKHERVWIPVKPVGMYKQGETVSQFLLNLYVAYSQSFF